MVDQVTEQLYQSLIRDFPPTSSYSLADLASRKIRPDLFTLLTFSLEEKADQQIQQIELPGSEWFDLSDPAIKEKWSDFVVMLKRHPVFPSADWADELRTAVRMLTEYTILPVKTLAEFLFADADVIRLAVVPGKLKRFTTHRFVIDSAERLVAESPVSELSRSDFKRLLQEKLADRLEGLANNEIEGMSQVVFDVVSKATGTAEIPLQLVGAFYDDIGRKEIASRIHNHADRYRLTKIDRDQLGDALIFRRDSIPVVGVESEISGSDQNEDSVAQVDELSLTWSSASSEVRVESDANMLETAEHQGAESEVEPDDKPAPLWMTFQKKLNAPVVESTSSKSKTVDQSAIKTEPKPADEVENTVENTFFRGNEPINVPMWERFRNRRRTGDGPKDFSAAEIRVLGETGRHQRAEIISKLFDGSTDEYRTVIQDLDVARNWDEASVYIAEQVFRKHKVNIYSELAVAFTNAVEQRYRAIQTD